MKKIVIYLFFYILICLIQFSLGQFISVKGVFPNFILIAIVYLSLSKSQTVSEIFAFIFGLTWDTFSVGVFGARTLVFTIIGFVTYFLKEMFDKDQPITQMLIVFFANVVSWIGISLAYLISPLEIGSFIPFKITLPGIFGLLITIIITPVVFFVLDLIFEEKEKRYI